MENMPTCKPDWEKKDRRIERDRRQSFNPSDLAEFIEQFFVHNDWSKMELEIISRQILNRIQQG